MEVSRVQANSIRLRAADVSARLVARAIRVSGFGQGETFPGRVALAVAPDFVYRRAEGIDTVLVTGTNGKTTTTAFLFDLLSSADGGDSVVANRGSNLPGGVAAALAAAGDATSACFEVDEAYVPQLASELRAKVMVWLNMSRDQLDRSMEVRKLSRRVGEAGTV